MLNRLLLCCGSWIFLLELESVLKIIWSTAGFCWVPCTQGSDVLYSVQHTLPVRSSMTVHTAQTIKSVISKLRIISGELRHFLNLTKPDMVLCSKQVGDRLYENEESFGSICSEYSTIKSVYIWGSSEQNSMFPLLSTLLDTEHHSTATKERKLYEKSTSDGSREALIFASSGSTGLPKGILT